VTRKGRGAASAEAEQLSALLLTARKRGLLTSS
jgi:hypothetical protein